MVLFSSAPTSSRRVGINDDELWDEEDSYYYDVLRLQCGEAMRVKVRSMVGLILP